MRVKSQKYKGERNLSTYNPNKFGAQDSAISYLVFLVLFFIIGLLTKPLFMYFYRNEMKDIFFLLTVSAVISQLMILTIAATYGKLCKVSLISGGGYKKSYEVLPILFGVLLVLGMLWLFTPVTQNFVDSVYFLGGKSSPSIPIEEADALFGLIFIVFASSILPAVCEELLFRSVILRGLTSYGKIFAVIFSALLFALAHGSLSQFLYQFLVGVAIGGVYVLTKNIIAAMAMHLANNLFASLFALLTANASASQDYTLFSFTTNLTTAVGILLGTICFIAGIVYFILHAANDFKKQKSNEISAQRSCVSDNADGENYKFYNYDAEMEYYSAQKPVYFSWRKGFVPMRKNKTKYAPLIFTISICIALFLIINNYFTFF